MRIILNQLVKTFFTASLILVQPKLGILFKNKLDFNLTYYRCALNIILLKTHNHSIYSKKYCQ